MNNKKSKMGPPKKGEKPKNMGVALNNLFKELTPFKTLIIISLILAMLGSILSILAPNKLSKLTDTISEGLIINTTKLEELSNEINNNMLNSDISNKSLEILNIDLKEENIGSILTSENINEEDKETFKNTLMKINEDKTNTLIYINDLPNSIKEQLIRESYINNIKITQDDKIKYLNTLSKIQNKDYKNLIIPDSISKIILKEIKFDNKIIKSTEQAKFINIMSTIDFKEKNKIYNKLDKLPNNIKKIIEPKMNIKKIKIICLFLLILYISSALLTYIETIMMTVVSNKLAKSLRDKISKKINRLPLHYFDKNSIGDTLSRVTNDVDTIAQSLNQSLSSLVSALTLFIGTIIMMFVTNYIMALTAIISSLLGFFFMALILSKSQKYFTERQEQLGKLNGHIEEIYSGLNVIKAYNAKKLSDKKFDELNEKVMTANRKSQFLSGLMMPMMNFVGNLGFVAVCIVGAILTQKEIITFGVIVAFMTYVRLFTSPLSSIAQAMTSIQQIAASSERVFDFLKVREMKSEKDIKESLDKNKVKGNIEFKNVTFTYSGNKTPTIKNFSAKVKKGQKIAIVGPTGAGKTTMVNLLMKFYNIDDGEILIDGISTKKLTRENIHSLFTMVLQDTWLFDGTIKENIIYNRQNISDKQIEEVCKMVGIDHFIKTLPNGIDTNISNNDSVSAGQRQLLTIARAMLEDTPFVILDEATSNVDTRTEELVQIAMDKLAKGKTSFIIAHRLSTIKNADLILVMKDGNIIEKGTHEELLNQNGFYKDLYNSQFEL